MSEELRELPVPIYLSGEEKAHSRLLYEKIFCEDTERFVDYYYQYKIQRNRVLGLLEDGQLVSMLHRNPYTVIFNGYEVKSDYIVAVATDENFRHRGYMRMLLERALRDMASARMPFTFLMPASESIYAPFDFVWICPYTPLPAQVERMDADGQNRYLAVRYQMFCKRDAQYMEDFRARRLAEEGEEPDTAGKIPPYMARITDVCRMLELVNSIQNQKLYLHVRDSVIRENNGYFLWESSREYSHVGKLSEKPERTDLDLTIGELTSMVFDGLRICLSEPV